MDAKPQSRHDDRPPATTIPVVDGDFHVVAVTIDGPKRARRIEIIDDHGGVTEITITRTAHAIRVCWDD